MTTRAPSPASAVTAERRAQFDRVQFRARLAVVSVFAIALAVLPPSAVGAHARLAALVVGVGAGAAHFLARKLTGVPNPTGWLDMIAVVTGTVVAAIDPTIWPAALLFQMLVLGGAVSFLPSKWTVAMGGWSVASMGVVALLQDQDAGLQMIVVAAVFLPVFVSGSVRKQARIKRASMRMEAVAASLPMVVWEWDSATHRMSAVVGRTDEVFGRSVNEVMRIGLLTHVHSSDYLSFKTTYDALRASDGSEPVELEYRYVRPDGEIVWLRDQATLGKGINGAVIRGVTLDITDSRAKELDLHRHRQIVERMPALTIVVERPADGPAGRVLEVVDPIGWGATRELAGTCFTEAFPSLAERLDLAEAVQLMATGDLVRIGPWEVDDATGTPRTVEVEMFPLPGSSIALLVDDVTEREEMMARVRHQARHDDLTGLLNRAALLQVASDSMASGSRCTLLLIDLNDFKSINDTLGHLTGDHYLAVIGQRLHELAAEHEYVTRLGGDEFAMLLVDPTVHRTAALVDAVVSACRQPVTLHGVPLAGSASVGVAETPTDATDAEALLRCADLAMYHAKTHQHGASRYQPSMERSTDPLRLLGRLGKAFQDNEFVMHFQPKVDAHTGRTVAFEALVRWDHPQLGVLQPDAFLDLVAVSGHLDSLGGIAVRQAAHALAQLPHEISVAINLTAQNLRNLAFPSMCDAVFAEHGVDLDRLIVEVTESHVLDASGVTHSVIDEMAARGIRVSVDDFGTGYSSLTHLRSLPLSELKIDRRFVTNLTRDDQDLVIVRSMIDLGHNLGLQVVAEGVEDEATLELLHSLGCDVVQGYHLGKPAPLVQAIVRCARETELAMPAMPAMPATPAVPVLPVAERR
ncbi:MAG: EAL domain-containing protein [Acidimicrobiales bacterium]